MKFIRFCGYMAIVVLIGLIVLAAAFVGFAMIFYGGAEWWCRPVGAVLLVVAFFGLCVPLYLAQE